MTQLADVNGDGLADLIEFPNTMGGAYAFVHLANSSGRLSQSTIETGLCQLIAKGRVFMADVNGDGLADVIQTNAMNYYAYVHLADGSGRFGNCTSNNLGYATDPGTVNFADLNGDGLSDLALAPMGQYVYTFFSNGRGGFEFATSTNASQAYNDPGYIHFGDVNGDGFADLIKGERMGSNIHLFLGDGTGALRFQYSRTTDNDGFAFVVDINGDGLSDLLKFKTLNTYVYAYLAEGLSNNDVHPDILNRIDNGYGVQSTITYALSTRYQYVHAPSTSYPNAYLPFCLDLLDRIVINDGIGNGSITTSYNYYGARYDIREKEYLGLTRIVRNNPNGTTLNTDYNTADYFFKGRPTQSNYSGGSSIYVNTSYTPEKIALENNAYWVRTQRQNTTLSSGGTASTEAAYQYHYHTGDYFGHLYEITQSGSGTGNLVTQTDFVEKGDWIWRIADKRISLGGTTARNVSYGYDSSGNCTRETHQNNSGSDAVINRGFDSYGNVDWEDDPNGKRTDLGYTSGTFLSSKSFEGLTTSYSNFNQWGKPRQVTDPNGGNTNITYDDYGRPTEEDTPGPGRKNIDYYETARPRYTVTRIYDGSGTSADTYEYIDGLGRHLQTTVRGALGDHKTTRLYYDGAGRNHLTIGPFFTSNFNYYSSTTIPSSAPYRRIGTNYDFLNRPLRIETPRDESGTAVTAMSYSGFDRTITDPDNKSTTEGRDYLGRIQTIRDADGYTTNYEYNGAGDLIEIVDSMGYRTTRTHNTLGHMTVLDDPDLGRWTFAYKPNGEVETRTDQKGQVATFGYNNRNQLTSKTYTNVTPAEPAVTMTYDSGTNGRGRPYQVIKGNVTTTFNAYDDMGRVTRKTIAIDGQNYIFQYGYDPAGNMTSMTYPDGYVLTFDHFSGTALLNTVVGTSPAVNVTLSQYGNFDQAGQIQYPSITASIDHYSRTGRVNIITVPGLMSADYSYTAAGDVSGIYDSIRNISYTYGYDNLHRLTSETAVGPFPVTGSRNLDLFYESPDERHAVSRVVSGSDTYSLIYEDNGNLVIGYDFSKSGLLPQRQLDYNAENMPTRIVYTPDGGTAVTTTLTYDGDGRRAKKESGSNTAIYVDETYEIRNGQPIKYVFAGDLRLAKITGSQVEYYHKDALGSTSVTTGSDAALRESMSYEAYGQPRLACSAQTTGKTAYTYTDQEWDGETGLYNYDARMYDPVLGRFLSADSIVPDWYDPQALDRYAYARNNPAKYSDPDGHDIVVLQAFRGAGGAGHSAMLIEQKDIATGKTTGWVYYSRNGENKGSSTADIGTNPNQPVYNSPEHFFREQSDSVKERNRLESVQVNRSLTAAEQSKLNQLKELTYYDDKNNKATARYDVGIRISTGILNDSQGMDYALKHQNDPYYLIGLNSNCKDLVRNTLEVMGVATNDQTLPNLWFRNLMSKSVQGRHYIAKEY
jgi:RHS repeat-associated protein